MSASSRPTDVPTAWESRIVEHAEVDPSELMANPLNWRIHPTHQREAVRDVLKQVGWVQSVIVNKTTGNMIDGHLRVDLAVEEGEPKVPVGYIEISEDEERLILAALDPLAGLAVADPENLALLMDGLEVNGEVLAGFLDDLAQAVGTPPEIPPSAPEQKDFWPRVTFQLPSNLYAEWQDFVQGLDGEEDHEKIVRLLELARESSS